VAGHSADAGELATKIGASNLRMLPSTLSSDVPAGCGLNFGVVTRPTTAEAWADAGEIFPQHANTARVVLPRAPTRGGKLKFSRRRPQRPGIGEFPLNP